MVLIFSMERTFNCQHLHPEVKEFYALDDLVEETLEKRHFVNNLINKFFGKKVIIDTFAPQFKS